MNWIGDVAGVLFALVAAGLAGGCGEASLERAGHSGKAGIPTSAGGSPTVASKPGATASATPASASEAATARIRAVATVGMVADVVSAVGAERVEVVTLIGPGLDPHLYKPTRTDIERLLNAQIVFCNGLRLEGQMGESLDRAAKAGRTVVAVGESIPASEILGAGEGHHDPHIWMDPKLWAGAVAVVVEAMARIDPAGERTYRSNGERYATELRELDAYASRVLSSVPERQRVLVTAHDAFQYFGRRFGYEVVGIQGISTESEASLKDIERLVDLLVTRRIGAVFFESTVSDRNMRALLAGAASRGHTVRLGGELHSDAMGPPGTYEGTYVGMIDHNVTVITRSLGGEAPERGSQGKLKK